MKKPGWEVRVMNYFAENINLPKCMELAKKCAKDILDLRFNEIAFGNYELPPPDELKKTVKSKIPYEFDPKTFIEEGPIDLSGLDDEAVKKAVSEIESLYRKFHDAQAKAIAKAAAKHLEHWTVNIKKELSALRKKYLS